jgi:hypothetical protein
MASEKCHHKLLKYRRDIAVVMNRKGQDTISGASKLPAGYRAKLASKFDNFMPQPFFGAGWQPPLTSQVIAYAPL